MIRAIIGQIAGQLAIFAIGCGVAGAGDLPDPTLTPGVARPDLTVTQICNTAWGKDERHVSARMKKDVLAAYRTSAAACPSGRMEIDHLISRELGGADDERNLWPECYEAPVAGLKPSQVPEWGAHKKDRLENRLNTEVCSGRLDLDQARAMEASDWRQAYIRYFGQPGAARSAARNAARP